MMSETGKLRRRRKRKRERKIRKSEVRELRREK